MTKNRSIKIAVLVLALALITSCFVGTTFAKYESEGAATGTLTVAEWNVSFAGDNISAGQVTAKQIALFDTIKDTQDAGQVPTDADEAEVATGKIAPGTSGAFNLDVVNNSEVSVEYTITFTVEDDNDTVDVPLLFKVNDGEWKDSLEEATGTIAWDAGSKTSTVNVQWMWDFEGDDNAVGIAAPEVTVTAEIVVSQIN